MDMSVTSVINKDLSSIGTGHPLKELKRKSDVVSTNVLSKRLRRGSNKITSQSSDLVLENANGSIIATQEDPFTPPGKRVAKRIVVQGQKRVISSTPRFVEDERPLPMVMERRLSEAHESQFDMDSDPEDAITQNISKRSEPAFEDTQLTGDNSSNLWGEEHVGKMETENELEPEIESESSPESSPEPSPEPTVEPESPHQVSTSSILDRHQLDSPVPIQMDDYFDEYHQQTADDHEEDEPVAPISNPETVPKTIYSYIDDSEEEEEEHERGEEEYSQYIPSQIYEEDDDDDAYENTQKPDDKYSPPLRRSSRVKVAPLKFWKNERIVFNYDREHDAPKIREIYYAPTPEVKKKTTRKRKNNGEIRTKINEKKTTNEANAPNDEDNTPSEPPEDTHDFDQPPNVEIEVSDYPDTNVKSRRIVAWSATAPQFQQVRNSTFALATLFDKDSAFTAGGIMSINVNGMKPLKSSKHNSYTFYVICGAIEVTIGESTFLLAKGSTFEVPRGNHYSISNISHIEVRLFFVQGTDTLENNLRKAAI